MKKDSFILSQLNPIQQQAVIAGNGPMLILAGAGSGKTKVLTHRAAYLMREQSISPENIILVTFTNKAAEEMRKRIKKLADKSPSFAGTFHSLCARILRKEGEEIGISPQFTIYDESDQKETIKMAMEEIGISSKGVQIPVIVYTISQAKNELVSALEYAQYARGDFQLTIARVYLTYQKLLKKHSALDFDDLLSEAVRLFQNHADILTKYQDQFHHILVDEYQDTNRAQYMLTALLAKRRRNLFVVGDASQAIYSWRGANYQNLNYLKRDFPEIKIFHLEQNYRSTQTILDAANTVIRKNTTHPILNLWTENPIGEKIGIYRAGSEIEEASFAAAIIVNSGLSYDQFAVLYRTNAQSRVIEEVFLKNGIPYLLVGGIRFYERREIKDCLALLRVIENPKDIVSWQRIEKMGKNKLKKYKEAFDSLDPKTPTPKLLDKSLAIIGYLESFNQENEDDLHRLENIKELFSVASEYQKLREFLESVALVQRDYLPNSIAGRNKKAATLSTLHAAKGTEFPVVFLIGMEEGIFPHSKSLFTKEEIEEERRLCYVGMTRAKNKLYLCYSRKRLFFGRTTTNSPSRFLADIPPSLTWQIG